MQHVTIDTIVNSVLLRRGYSYHWYLQFMKYATDCVRELSYHTIKTVDTLLAQADEYGQIPLPNNYERWLRVGLPNGQHVRPMVQGKGFYRKLQQDGDGNPIPYVPENGTYGGPYGWLSGWLANTNEFGENLGGVYGFGAGYETDVFEIIEERNVLQVSAERAGSWIVMDYLPSVNEPNNLTRIPAAAQATIEQYVVWQMKEHARHYSKGEAKDEERMYYNELRHLRARLTPMSAEDYLRIFRREHHSTAKS
jgi:hypothetical protein